MCGNVWSGPRCARGGARERARPATATALALTAAPPSSPLSLSLTQFKSFGDAGVYTEARVVSLARLFAMLLLRGSTPLATLKTLEAGGGESAPSGAARRAGLLFATSALSCALIEAQSAQHVAAVFSRVGGGGGAAAAAAQAAARAAAGGGGGGAVEGAAAVADSLATRDSLLLFLRLHLRPRALVRLAAARREALGLAEARARVRAARAALEAVGRERYDDDDDDGYGR